MAIAGDAVFSKQEVEQIKIKAEQGDAEAQNNLAVVYYTGQGATQYREQAHKWFSKAAEQGHVGAKTRLGFVYFNSIPQDLVLARMWFNLAATSGSQDAIKARDLIAKLMAPNQIEKAQNLAREWSAKYQQ